ncbi:MAG: ParA family protein [Anaerolineales bacterium]|nr:MAG: ParA family protein [Anaerolineales bacterium]
MAKVYTFANQKGGVGKTTSVVNISAFLAAQGCSALVVDVDPQANATSSLGLEEHLAESLKSGDEATVYHALIEGAPVSQIIQTTRRPRLHLVPSSPALAGAEVELVGMLARETLLRKALAPVLRHYDYVMIDTPPSLGLLTVNALTAADGGVIIPVQCEYLALEGLGQLLRTVNLVRDSLNPRLTIAGVVLTMYDTRTRLSQEVADEVRRYFPKQVFKTVIPRNVRLSEAPSFGETILTYSPGSAGALAYGALTDELLGRQV